MRRKPRIERRGAPTFCQIDLRSSTPQRTLKRSLQDRRKIGEGEVSAKSGETQISRRREGSAVSSELETKDFVKFNLEKYTLG